MTILQTYRVAWFHDLSFRQLSAVLANAEAYEDWNRLGFLRALVERRQLTLAQTVQLRDRFREKYPRYYQHRAFTHTELVAFLAYLDVADRPAFVGFDRFGRRHHHARPYERSWSLFGSDDPRLVATTDLTLRPIGEADRFIEAAFQRGIAKVRKGAFHPYPQHRTRTVLSDPYAAYFGDTVDQPFQKINAHQLRDQYSYNKRNGAKYETQHLPAYPQHLPRHRSTKNHKNLYRRLENKQRRAAGQQLIRAWELADEGE